MGKHGQNLPTNTGNFQSCDKIEETHDSMPINEDDDHTLSILPNNGSKLVSLKIEKLRFLILSGEDKEKEITFHTTDMFSTANDSDKHCLTLKKVLEFDG